MDGVKCVRDKPVVPGGLRGFSHFTQHSATLRAGLSCHAPAAHCFSSFLLHGQKEELVLTQTLKAVPVKEAGLVRAFLGFQESPGTCRA